MCPFKKWLKTLYFTCKIWQFINCHIILQKMTIFNNCHIKIAIIFMIFCSDEQEVIYSKGLKRDTLSPSVESGRTNKRPLKR